MGGVFYTFPPRNLVVFLLNRSTEKMTWILNNSFVQLNTYTEPIGFSFNETFRVKKKSFSNTCLSTCNIMLLLIPHLLSQVEVIYTQHL